ATAVENSALLVTICDTGVSASHPDLVGNLRGDLGWNTASNNTDWSPVHYHGTAVAGAAAAVGNNTIGVSGVAQVAGIVPVRVSNRSDGAAEISDIVQCIEYGADIGSTVINLSYTTYTNGTIDSAILAAADYANERGSVLVIAAGNSNRDDAPGRDPENILYVAATTASNARASFSNFGKSIDIAAPGEDIFTTYSELVCRGRKCRVAADSYAFVSGTSFAAPIVAGAVVVAAAANSALLDDLLTPADRAAKLRSLIVEGACDVGIPGEDDFYGAGILNLHASVHADECDRLPPPPPEIAGVLVLPLLASVYVGDELQFEAIELWDDGYSIAAENVVWTSSNTSVATIEEATGLAVGVSTGGFISISATVGGVTGYTVLSVSERPPVGSLVGVVSITYATSGGRKKSKNLEITLSVVNNLDPRTDVEGASVDIWLMNELQLWTGTATTGADGSVTFTLSNAPSGTYTTIVMGVTAAGLTWDGVTPSNAFTK
ncbi:MAG: S8 family serine peptidase, partial [Dehalococcoidia bacterium]